MRGSVIKRGKTWSYVVYLGRDDSGRKRQKWKGGFATKREAEDGLTEMLERLRVGTYVDAGRMTVREYCHDWLAAISPGLRTTTADSYCSILDRHVLPRIGDIKLTALTPVNISRLNQELLTSGRHDGKGGLSPTSVVYAHRVLKHALTDAVSWGAIPRNPAALVTPPRKAETEMSVWMAADARRFLEAMAADRLYAMWLLLVMTGMRRGEVLGLRWQDVDLDLGRLAIRQTLVEVRYQLIVSEPKTRRSRRSVALDPATIDVLRAHRERQASERLPLVQPSDRFGELVFQTIDGRPLQPQNVSQSFTNTIRRLGLPPIRLHDLRHSSATLALAAGIHPKVVSERLGHSSIAITLDTYSHVIPGLQESAASELASLILGTPPPAATG